MTVHMRKGKPIIHLKNFHEFESTAASSSMAIKRSGSEARHLSPCHCEDTGIYFNSLCI